MVAKSKSESAKSGTDKKESKERAPRQDYGYKPGAKITLTKEASEKKYRGKRAEYFAVLEKCDGKTVEDFEKAAPAGDPPRGWLRFFVQDGAATLSGGKEPEKKPAKKEKEAA